MNRLIDLWIWLVTAAAPPGPRDRRREERAAHLWEARAAGIGPVKIARATARGALDDMRWCRDERARAGWAPLVAGPVGSMVIAGLCMVGAFVTSIEETWLWNDTLSSVFPGIAATALIASFADLLWRRRRRRVEPVDDPIFP